MYTIFLLPLIRSSLPTDLESVSYVLPVTKKIFTKFEVTEL